MNKNRRKVLSESSARLNSVLENLRCILDTVTSCRDEEEDSLYNTPENLSGSDRCLSMEDNIDKMNDAIYSIREAIESLDGI